MEISSLTAKHQNTLCRAPVEDSSGKTWMFERRKCFSVDLEKRLTHGTVLLMYHNGHVAEYRMMSMRNSAFQLCFSTSWAYPHFSSWSKTRFFFIFKVVHADVPKALGLNNKPLYCSINFNKVKGMYSEYQPEQTKSTLFYSHKTICLWCWKSPES